MIRLYLTLFTLLISGCATYVEKSEFSDQAEMGIHAYNTGRPELAVILLEPAVMSYINQDSDAYLSNINLSESEFDVAVDYLLVASWEAGRSELHNYLVERYSSDIHDEFKQKGRNIGNYGKVRIKQLWQCLNLEDNLMEYLEAARCWRSIGNKDRAGDNFKAHYIKLEMGRKVVM